MRHVEPLKTLINKVQSIKKKLAFQLFPEKTTFFFTGFPATQIYRPILTSPKNSLYGMCCDRYNSSGTHILDIEKVLFCGKTPSAVYSKSLL